MSTPEQLTITRDQFLNVLSLNPPPYSWEQFWDALEVETKINPAPDPSRCRWWRHRWGRWEIFKQCSILGGEATHQRKVCQDCGKAKQRSVWSEG